MTTWVRRLSWMFGVALLALACLAVLGLALVGAVWLAVHA